MQLYVPEIGDQLRLTEDWYFTLYNETRNTSLWLFLKCSELDSVKQIEKDRALIEEELHKMRKVPYNQWKTGDQEQWYNLTKQARALIPAEVVLPAGSLLTIDRIFIRKGLEDWSSLTFYLNEHPTISFKKKPRFWVKLDDCNRIVFSQISNINIT